MASASSQLNAVSHNRFTALATEDMDFCAGGNGNDTTTTDAINDQEVLRSIGGTAVAVRGNDLHPSDIVGWKISVKQALEAHRIGNTTSIVILFAGTKVPNYIKYGSIIVKCALYRQHHNVCRTCGKIGHRADVCPTPETKICFACGAPNPEADHVARCKPRCKLCNGAHATGAEGCANKYKVPFVVTQRRWERRNAGSTFSSQDFPQLPPQQQNEAHLSKKRSSRSKKRDQSRGRSASRGRSTDDKRSENMNYNRNQQRPGNVVGWAQAINPQAANHNPLNHVAQAKDNTVQSLRNENDQLKRCIAEQGAQIQEMNAKLHQLINAQQQQQATPTPSPPSPPQIQPSLPTPTENKTKSAMEVQTPVTTEANSAEPETTDIARTNEPAPKKRALEYARERRANARLDSQEERQDRLEQTMRANYETLSQAIKATNDRLDATNARLDTLVTPVHGMQSTIQGIQTKLDVLIHALTASGLITQQAFTQPQ
ncbi:hypothetical protein MTO96_040106 [Rhipicephalus appendiculatus]